LGDGIDELWVTVEQLVKAARAAGELAQRRTEQARAWMWSEVTDTMLEELRDDPEVNARIASLEADVTGGRISAAAAARRVLAAFRAR
jgi:LAO/AO transport system kinase